jgi:hypothetical protein
LGYGVVVDQKKTAVYQAKSVLDRFGLLAS